MEYTSGRVCDSWVCVGHVYFMLFVLIVFALGTQGKHYFCWNTMVKMLKPYAKIQRFIITMLKKTAYLQCCYKKLYVRTPHFGTIYYFTNIKDASLYCYIHQVVVRRNITISLLLCYNFIIEILVGPPLTV